MTDRERFKAIYETQITRPGAEEFMEWLESTDFFTAPASTRFHGSYPGGLVKHSLNVYDALLRNTYGGPFAAETKALTALLHDVCKANLYEETGAESGPRYRHRDKFPFGHGEKSVYLISKFMRLTDQEALAIRWHMGAYDDAAKGGSRTLSEAMKFSPLVLALHTADMEATQEEKGEE